MVEAPVLGVLIPFVLDAIEIPGYLSEPVCPVLTTVYNGVTFVAEAEGDAKDQAQVESSVKNLRWALQHGRVVDLDIESGIIAIDTSGYDGLVNLLSRAIKSNTDTNRTPIVLSRWHPSSPDTVLTCRVQPTYYLPHLAHLHQSLR